MSQFVVTPNTASAPSFANGLQALSKDIVVDNNDPKQMLDVYFQYFDQIVETSNFLESLAPLALFFITTTPGIDIEYFVRFVNQMSTNPQQKPLVKAQLLEFALGLHPETDPLRFDAFLSFAYVVCYGLDGIPFDATGVLASITPENMKAWTLEGPGDWTRANWYAYKLQRRQRTSFSSREFLSRALANLSTCTPEQIVALGTLPSEIAHESVNLTLSLPSHQLSLDTLIGYDTLLAQSYISGAFAQANPETYALLGRHTQGSLAETISFVNDSGFQAICDKAVVDAETTRSNLIALSVAATIESGRTYAVGDLRALTGIEDWETIEEAFVEASANGQISTKIDQLKQSIQVTRVVPRAFNPEKHWSFILDRLTSLSASFIAAADAGAKESM